MTRAVATAIAEHPEALVSRADGAIAAVGEAAWFAVWTRNQYEPKVAEALHRKAVEVFLPRVAVPSARRDRCRVLSRPLFPGYLFVRLVLSRESYIQVASTDGVVRLLGDWDALHPIPDAEVDAVRRIIATSARARAVPWIRVGDRVRIVAGPLVGLEGFVQGCRGGRSTFVVSIDLLQRSVAVEVAAEVLQRS